MLVWVLRIMIVIVLLATYIGIIPLVKTEYLNGDICPRIVGIPACYIILVCLLLVTIGINIPNGKWRLMFYLGVLPALVIASYGSLGQLVGFAECPKTSSGIPMCYISFGIFSTLFILNYFIYRFTS